MNTITRSSPDNDADETTRLLLGLSRITAAAEDMAVVEGILSRKNFDRADFIARCFRQRTAGMVAYNLDRWDFWHHLPPWMWMPLKLFYVANCERNRRLVRYRLEIEDFVRQQGIDIRPLKGSVLLPLVYSDGGSRILYDIDFFIKREDLGRLAPALASLGLEQAERVPELHRLVPLSREERLTWGIKMFETPAFKRQTDDDFLTPHGILTVDFSFGFVFGEAVDISQSVMSRSDIIGGIKTLSRSDFFIQLCTHLYKEATNEAWIESGLDINLVKFCDVREFVLAEGKNIDIGELRGRSAALQVEKAIYFSMRFTHELYGDPMLMEMLESLDYKFDDHDFLETLYRQGGAVIGNRGQAVKSRATVG